MDLNLDINLVVGSLALLATWLLVATLTSYREYL